MPQNRPSIRLAPCLETERDLTVRLFGPTELFTVGGPIRLPSRRTAWLLAILAMRRGTPIERTALARMVWPDSADAAALHNLRQTLAGLRRALGPAGERLVAVSPRSIALVAGPGVWVDLWAFDDAVSQEDQVEAWEAAVEIARGSLLADCDEPFARLERETRERSLHELCERLALRHASMGEPARAAEAYRRVLAFDPFRESAARGLMSCLAQSGEAAAALEVYRSFAQALRNELGSEPGGETKALHRSLRAELNRPKRREGGGRALGADRPKPLTPLIGRRSEVASLVTLLDRCRLVTVVGPGGVGKTRLALAVAEAYEERGAGSTAFVDLASERDVDGVAVRMSHAFGAPEAKGSGALTTLARWLSDESWLVVIDNCEHLVEGVASALEELLSRSRSVRVLATSRQPLGVAGEMAWRAEPLATPSPKDAPEEARRSPSVRLFLDRYASAVRPGSPSDAEIATIGSICRRLDGIPLAIEFAAARTNLLSVDEIEARLGDRFAFLGGGRRSDPRQETLRATMEWSWDLLADSERELLETLSIFRGGATVEATEAVFGGAVLDLLSRLVDRSLLVVDRGVEGSRFRLLETVREFASNRLIGAEREETVRQGHATYFFQWAAAAAAHFNGPEEKRWFERIEREHPNLLAALEWFHASGRGEEELRLAVCLSRFWDTHGHLSQGRAHLERAIRSAGSEISPALAAAARGHAGWMATIQRDVGAARGHYEQALAYFRSVEDQRAISVTLNCLGGANLYAGDYATAQALYEEALQLCRERKRPKGVATVLSNLGELALYKGDLTAARDYFDRSVEEGGLDADAPQMRALVLWGLALTDLRQGRIEEALANARESLRQFVEAQAVVSLPDATGLLAFVQGALGRWDRAAELLGVEQGLALSQGVPLSPLTEPERTATAAEARERLGGDVFGIRYGQGQRRSIEEAVAFALEE